MKITTHKGRVTKSRLQNAYYLHPTLKIQPYGEHGFELVLWFIDMYVSIRVIRKH
jgi:hypothetical protein